jgi:16S rRNA (uracil1498-N3)-methyltransferase
VRRRFFVEQFDKDSAALRGVTAEHLGRVLRARPGQVYELSDGHRVWLARVERIVLSKTGHSRIDFALVEPVAACEPSLEMEVLLSVVKFERFEACLEKATELGATRIIPLSAARTDQPLLAAAGKRHARWQRIVVESAQQSRRLRPPALDGVSSPDQAFTQCSAGCKILLSERRQAAPMREALASANGILNAALAVGPEGGWTDAEIRAGCAAGFIEASLGENILRTETAALASLAILRFAAGA